MIMKIRVYVSNHCVDLIGSIIKRRKIFSLLNTYIQLSMYDFSEQKSISGTNLSLMFVGNYFQISTAFHQSMCFSSIRGFFRKNRIINWNQVNGYKNFLCLRESKNAVTEKRSLKYRHTSYCRQKAFHGYCLLLQFTQSRR